MEILLSFLPILGKIATVALIIAACMGLFWFVGKILYKPATPNKVMVITSPWGCKTVCGKGAFLFPIIQRADFLSLENIQADFVSRTEIPTKDAINIFVDAVANMSISTDPELLKIASSKFLGYSTNEIKKIVIPVLEGNVREIISQITLKDLIQGDKKLFSEKVIENVTPNLRDMGLSLTTFNIQSFKDKDGVIENLGIENTVSISKDAAMARAKAEQEIAVAQAEAEKLSNDARVAAEQEIAIKNNELAVKKAELKKEADIKKAEADAAYTIQQEEQRKQIEITTANANLARQEKEIELKEREVAITEKTLEAEIKKRAEANRYAKQEAADAELYEIQRQAEADLFLRQKQAEAEKFEAEQKAEALKAEAIAKKIAAEAEADGIAAKGKAEAAAIKAKAEAEAKGMMEKAEAMKQYGDAARQQMELETLKVYFEQLPAIAEAAGKAYTNVDSIYMYGGETSKLTEDIMKNVTQVSEGLSQSMGIDLKSLLSGVFGAKLVSKKEETIYNEE